MHCILSVAITCIMGQSNTGACVLPPCPNQCVDLTEASCLISGGMFQGVGTNCMAACCLQNGSCITQNSINCRLLGGQYYGYSTMCSTIVCQPICPQHPECCNSSCAGGGIWWVGNPNSPDAIVSGKWEYPNGTIVEILPNAGLRVGTFVEWGFMAGSPDPFPSPVICCDNIGGWAMLEVDRRPKFRIEPAPQHGWGHPTSAPPLILRTNDRLDRCDLKAGVVWQLGSNRAGYLGGHWLPTLRVCIHEILGNGANFPWPLTVFSNSNCPGDLDGNNLVDLADFLLLLVAWGQADNCQLSDIDENGIVNTIDLMILLSWWGECDT